jgi:hypothetical protein
LALVEAPRLCPIGNCRLDDDRAAVHQKHSPPGKHCLDAGLRLGLDPQNAFRSSGCDPHKQSDLQILCSSGTTAASTISSEHGCDLAIDVGGN